MTWNFLLDKNITTVIVTINKLVHPVKFYYFAVVDCEKYV